MPTISTDLVLDLQLRAEISESLSEAERKASRYLLKVKIAIMILQGTEEVVQQHKERIASRFALPLERVEVLYGAITEVDYSGNGRDLASSA